jgi:hypothetical protein
MMLHDNLQRHRQQNALPSEINAGKPLFDIGIMIEEVLVEVLTEPRVRAGNDQLETDADAHHPTPATKKRGSPGETSDNMNS